MKSSLSSILTAVALLGLSSSAWSQSLSLVELVQSDAQPTGIHHAGDGSGRLFFLSKAGNVLVYDGGTMLPQSFLDITALVNSSGGERGLHGLAFHQDYPGNGYFYVMYTDLASDSVLARYQVSEDSNVADPDSAEFILMVDQPDEWHNISQLQFGPDGYLYIGAGDGGFIGDPDNRAQDLSDLLGKILRIDVDGPFPYGIPTDNPFVGVPGARPEIWAYGVRNPWRFSFDRVTGDLYMGDVGQFIWEEINFQPAAGPGGENYGWRLMEGMHCYDPPVGCEQPGLTMPILEFEHTAGRCAVTGGFVYRGARFPRFQGRYFYADWCTGNIWAARRVGGGDWTTNLLLDATINPTTFGEDEAGELYIGDDGSGRIYELVDPRPFCDVESAQAVYTEGEEAIASVARAANYGTPGFPARLQVGVLRPGNPPLVLLSTAFPLPPGTDSDMGPISMFTVEPDTPTGQYRLICRLTNIDTGTPIHQNVSVFEVQ